MANTENDILTKRKLKSLLKNGENFTVEFKQCRNELNNSVFETVCSFSNRYGGFLLLGVNDSGAKRYSPVRFLEQNKVHH